jgi:hypothetical protein
MDKKVGDALSDDDIRGTRAKVEKPADVLDAEGGDEPRLTTAELQKAMALPRPRRAPPTDCHNAVYLQYLASRPPPDDKVKAYVDAMKEREAIAAATRPAPSAAETEAAEGKEVYNYAGQRLQFSGLEREYRQSK